MQGAANTTVGTTASGRAMGAAASDGVPLGELLGAIVARWPVLLGVPLLAGAAAFGISLLVPPTYTARTSFLPPQSGQSNLATALAALGPLASLTGGVGATRTPGDQYVALMQSATISQNIVERFKLMEAYGSRFQSDARKELAGNVRIGLGRKDGLITVEVDDALPQRAADMANRYVDELRGVTAGLAVSEAQQRRAFFEQQLKLTQAQLIKAQQALQAGGFNAGALKAEPRATAESYAKLRADVTAAEVRLEALRGTLTDAAPEVRQQLALLASMRSKLVKAEQAGEVPDGTDYVSRYREFKYQEALFELYARQFELARVDEARDGALIQVVDVATPPERPSKPRRALTALATAFIVAALMVLWLVARRTSLPNGPSSQAG